MQWIAYRLAQQQDAWCLPEVLLDRAVRLAFALHDVGKLDARWQAWAHAYQEEIGEPCPPDFMIAHTHYDSDNPEHEAAQKRARKRHPKPRTHAGEGADAGARFLFETLDGRSFPLYKAAFTAIARHHSPLLDSAHSYRLHEQAEAAIADALAAAGEEDWRQWVQWKRDSPDEEPDVQRFLIPPYAESPLSWWLYFIVVRNLRLCDGLSQEID